MLAVKITSLRRCKSEGGKKVVLAPQQHVQTLTISYAVKKLNDFPVPSRDVTNQTLPCREKFNYSRPGRVWLVTSRLGTGKSFTFFYIVHFVEGRFRLSKENFETVLISSDSGECGKIGSGHRVLPPSPAKRGVKAVSNNLNELNTPLLPTGIGER
jgi:hypothetical protein